jgi:hypothetical protein
MLVKMLQRSSLVINQINMSIIGLIEIALI